ncbi:uncharacterized protein [Littorina saxatilis]|uniref:Tyrosine specific protein phosphatases domain-containing protein n=1 Tax=Littorina saxatilis TaxID=31220 RepID=A0AAN9B9R5_9CAEN
MEIRITSLAVILAVLCEVLTETEPEQSTSLFPDRRKAPGVKSPKKCWWTKEITPDLHVAGRPTERQIKYAAEAGFKTILSLFTYPDSEPRQTFGGDPLPNTAEAQKIVEEIAGLKFITLLDPMDEWASVEAVEKLTKVMPSLPKPILLHCDRGYTISFVTLMYLANQTKRDPSFKPGITSDDFYNISAAMGLDFISRIPQEVVSEITGEPVPTNPTRPNTVPEDWMDYWVAHPVYKNWYTAGQITRSHLPVMAEVGYKSVVNLRSGIMLDGKPNQEEVNLLNIKDATGTYAKGDREPRQWKARLEETRINPNRPNHFISPESKVNYESNNTEEFGDEVGFQETTERVAFLKSPLEYYHMPLDSKSPMYGVFLAAEMSQLLEISEKGPVLVHCASGKRAAYVAVLAAAVQYDMDFDWAVRRIQELGFEVSKNKTPEIYRTYVNWLVTRRQPKDEL